MTNLAMYEAPRAVSLQAPVPPVLVVPDAYVKLQTYVRACDVEISGLGVVDFVDGGLVVRDVFLLRQQSSAASTNIEEEDVARFLDEFVRSGGDPQRLRLHWHSHARSPVFCSATDQLTQRDACIQAEWYVFLVMNHAGDVRGALQVNCPVPGYYDPVPVRLWMDPEGGDVLRAEVADKVSTMDVGAWEDDRWTAWGAGNEEDYRNGLHATT